MESKQKLQTRFAVRARACALALIVAFGLTFAPLAVPQRAAATELAPTAMAGAAGAASEMGTVGTQAASTAAAKKAVKNAKTIIKKAKATKGTDADKLKEVYAYIATDKSFGGVYQFGDMLSFYAKYGRQYYDPNLNTMKNSLVKKNYFKYAVDMFRDKKGTCYNYSSLFAVTAKQLLGTGAKVKIAVGPSKHTGTLNPYHSWVEVTMKGKTYVYDTQAGNNAAKKADDATKFGKFCGSLKSKLKANYQNYKGVKYVTVKL